MKALLAVFLLSLSCLAQNSLPPIGHSVPEMKLGQLLQAPANTQPSLAALRGKAIVLEFWATWCGGCVAAIPHLNELAEQFKDKPVVFLSITDEDLGVVEAFLKRRPMSGWVGVDKHGLTFEEFGIYGRPQTLLIDAKGIVRAHSFPERTDAAVIERLIAGQPIASGVKQNKPVVLPMELVHGAPPPLLQVLLRPAASVSVSGNSPGWVGRADGGRQEYYGETLRTLLVYTEKVRKDRIVAPDWFDRNRYDVSTIVPQGRDDLRNALMQQVLAATFKFETHRELRPITLYVLRVTPQSQNKMSTSSAKESSGFRPHPGQFTGVATSISRLSDVLDRDLGEVEVVNETGLIGLYDFDLTWRKDNPESLQAAVHDQLGLTLTKETRDREFIIVGSATEPKTW